MFLIRDGCEDVLAGISNTFSVWTENAVPTGKSSEHPRGMPLVARKQELQASMRGSQWHPRV
jgi:hypothetical protein